MYRRQRIRHFLAATLVCALAAQPVAAFQFGGIFGSRSSSSDSENHCDTGGESVGRSILGGVLGGAARSIGIPTFVPMTQFSDVLATSIACRLDEQEQEKAADATIEATRSGEIGSTASWESESRPGVRGSSTVTGRSQRAGGSDCLEVTDVVIVEGEETTVPKTMCRRPPSTRYTLVA
jgi:surface antigen